MEAIYNFFAGYSAEDLIIMVVVGVLFLWPGFGVQAMNWLKDKWRLSAQRANMVIIGMLMGFRFWPCG